MSDIREELKELFYKVQKGYHPSRATKRALEILTLARKEERERCARIAKEEGDCEYVCGDVIAKAIRLGGIQ